MIYEVFFRASNDLIIVGDVEINAFHYQILIGFLKSNLIFIDLSLKSKFHDFELTEIKY
jgi:hypothetical protein